MNRERVKSIFLTLTGEKEATPFLLYIDSALERVSRLVKPEYQEYPPDCVHAYTAAIAAELFYSAVSAGEKIVCTEAGTAAVQRNTSDRRAAAAMQVKRWREFSADYLEDEEFVMMCTGKECECHTHSNTSGNEGTSSEGMSI